MRVREIHPEEVETVSAWLSAEENAKWLDFGAGRQSVDTVGLRVMIQRDLHRIRVFTAAEEDTPIGVVGLSNINRDFRTATLWFVLGRKEYGSRELTVRAVDRLLDDGFRELGLEAVNAWTVEINQRSARLLERLGFRRFGMQRHCHHIDGQPYGRLWYDLLADEHRRIDIKEKIET